MALAQQAHPWLSLRLMMVACFLRSQTVTAPAVVHVATMCAILGFQARLEMSALGPCWCPSWRGAAHTRQEGSAFI